MALGVSGLLIEHSKSFSFGHVWELSGYDLVGSVVSEWLIF